MNRVLLISMTCLAAVNAVTVVPDNGESGSNGIGELQTIMFNVVDRLTAIELKLTSQQTQLDEQNGMLEAIHTVVDGTNTRVVYGADRMVQLFDDGSSQLDSGLANLMQGIKAEFAITNSTLSAMKAVLDSK